MKLGVLASHGGTTLQAVLDHIEMGALNASVAVVISNNSKSGAMQRAQAANVATAHISNATHNDATQRDEAICSALHKEGVELVLLAGYMKQLGPKVLEAFAGRIINTHPSLLPKYGGQGFFGLKVHEAVIAAKEPTTGATVHVVTADYDTGPIVAQSTVVVEPQDTPLTLQERVKTAEQALLIKVLQEWPTTRPLTTAL